MFSYKQQEPICSQKSQCNKTLLQGSIQNQPLEGPRGLFGSSLTLIQPIMACLSARPMRHGGTLLSYKLVCHLLLMAVPTCRKARPSSHPAPSCSLPLVSSLFGSVGSDICVTSSRIMNEMDSPGHE